MKKRIIVCLFFVLICFSGCQTTEIDYSVDMTPRLISSTSILSAERFFESVLPATVTIVAKAKTTEAIGSGVAVASGGYILTNEHVINGANQINIYLANGEKTTGNIVYNNEDMDIAIVKCPTNIPYVEMSSSTNLQKGQDVIAVGTPLSLQFEQTVTKGVVSALNRTIEIENEFGATSYMQNLIQHDASINPGNSGGPLFNLRGQVVGINTLKASEAEGLGFAIPIEICVPIINKLSTGASFETPYLGLFGFDATTAKFYDKTAIKDGVYVLNVSEDGPCHKAGLKIGDVITKIGARNVSTLLDLRVELYGHQTGDLLTLTIDRSGEISTLQVILN